MCYNGRAVDGNSIDKELQTMTRNDFEQFREFWEMAEAVAAADKQDSFVAFIRFCVERLERGDPVQAIWSDYQEIAH